MRSVGAPVHDGSHVYVDVTRASAWPLRQDEPTASARQRAIAKIAKREARIYRRTICGVDIVGIRPRSDHRPFDSFGHALQRALAENA